MTIHTLSPIEEHDQQENANAAPVDEAFITGNGFASRCGLVLNYGPVEWNKSGRPDWCFCKTDYVEDFFASLAPATDFALFTHNSDFSIGPEHAHHFEHSALTAWFATNVTLEHPKIHPIPIGIANPRWPHGNVAALRRVQAERRPKTCLFEASFNVNTNPAERHHCLLETGVGLSPSRPFEAYLAQLASAYFCLSPNGNGIDCHRTWEALYLRTIPVVTHSALTVHHPDLPMIVLDDWSEFPRVDFSRNLYEQVMGTWEPDTLALDAYLKRVDRLAREAARS